MNLLLLLCFNGLVTVTFSIPVNIPHKYDLIMTRLSWKEAQNYCRSMYTDLATVVSDIDWLRLKKEATDKGLAESAWVGVYDDFTSWRWSLNDLPLIKLTYKNWLTGQPNNALSTESCVAVKITGRWYDTSCNFFRSFICYNAMFNDANKFIGIPTLVTWYDALAYCRTHHTDLASSLNSSDQYMITQLSIIQGESWIGLYRDTWKWSDGTNSSTFPWATGQPDNVEKILGNCASVDNGLLSDEPCTNLHYFFCHIIPTVRSHIKLHVKSDGSVFDPAVRSSVLELVIQKLEQNNMLKNTTVTWRVQPDRNIFHRN